MPNYQSPCIIQFSSLLSDIREFLLNFYNAIGVELNVAPASAEVALCTNLKFLAHATHLIPEHDLCCPDATLNKHGAGKLQIWFPMPKLPMPNGVLSVVIKP